jgi:integrase
MASSEDAKPKTYRRRANGDGTTWQDKHGQWWAALRFARGERPYKVRAQSKQDAEVKLRELRKRRDTAVDAPSSQTVGDWLETWMRDVVIPHNKSKTIVNYQERIENRLLPILGHIRLDALRPDDIRRMQSKLLALGKSPSTINDTQATLCTALQVAVDDRKIPYNAARSVRRLKVPKKDVMPLSISEVAAIFWAIEGHRLESMYHLSLLGLRIGELLGLRVVDVDVQAGTIRIAQQAVSLKNGHMIIETPKTEDSVRILPLSPYLVRLIQQRLALLLVERGREDWEEHGLLFPSERGTIISYTSIRKSLRITLTHAGIKRPWSWHKFRHTVISWLTDIGTAEGIIKAIAGHGDRDTTDRYRHVSIEAKRKALELLQETYLTDGYKPTDQQERNRHRRIALRANHLG